jgi:Na+/H+ antiporter NhaC
LAIGSSKAYSTAITLLANPIISTLVAVFTGPVFGAFALAAETLFGIDASIVADAAMGLIGHQVGTGFTAKG